MITRNIVGGIATTVIGIVYLILAMQIRVSALSDSFGPRGLPVVYGWLMTGFGVFLLVQSAIEILRLSPAARAAFIAKDWDEKEMSIVRAAGFLLIAICFLLLVSYLGYALTLAILIATVAIYMGARPGLRLAAIAVGGAVIMWVIFVLLLDVRMPQGVLTSFAS